MNARTLEHLQRAERNQQLAGLYLAHAATATIQPPPYEWVAVMGFYSAVHYVNAALSEIKGIDPGGHQNRSGLLAAEPKLRGCANEYRQLEDHGTRARYNPRYRLQEHQARELVDIALARVEATVRAALGIPSP